MREEKSVRLETLAEAEHAKLCKIAGSGNKGASLTKTYQLFTARLLTASSTDCERLLPPFLSTHKSSLAGQNFLLRALKFNIQTRVRERFFWKNTKFSGVEIAGAGSVAD